MQVSAVYAYGTLDASRAGALTRPELPLVKDVALEIQGSFATMGVPN